MWERHIRDRLKIADKGHLDTPLAARSFCRRDRGVPQKSKRSQKHNPCADVLKMYYVVIDVDMRLAHKYRRLGNRKILQIIGKKTASIYLSMVFANKYSLIALYPHKQKNFGVIWLKLVVQGNSAADKFKILRSRQTEKPSFVLLRYVVSM